MSRNLLTSLGLIVLLAGCSGPQQRAQEIAELTGNCTTEALQDALGEHASAELIETLQLQANAKHIRVTAPGDAVTQDYDSQRLNINIDESETIVQLGCG